MWYVPGASGNTKKVLIIQGHTENRIYNTTYTIIPANVRIELCRCLIQTNVFVEKVYRLYISKEGKAFTCFPGYNFGVSI